MPNFHKSLRHIYYIKHIIFHSLCLTNTHSISLTNTLRFYITEIHIYFNSHIYTHTNAHTRTYKHTQIQTLYFFQSTYLLRRTIDLLLAVHLNTIYLHKEIQTRILTITNYLFARLMFCKDENVSWPKRSWVRLLKRD